MSRLPKFNTPKVIAELQADLLRVKLRMERVKLRKLEWEMSRYALPHITPLPGDNEVQVRIPPQPEPKLQRTPEPAQQPEPKATLGPKAHIPWDPSAYGAPITDPNLPKTIAETRPETPSRTVPSRTVDETLKHAQAFLDDYNAKRAPGSRRY